MNLIAFEFGNVLLVKSTETGLTVFFHLCKLLTSTSTSTVLLPSPNTLQYIYTDSYNKSDEGFYRKAKNA